MCYASVTMLAKQKFEILAMVIVGLLSLITAIFSFTFGIILLTSHAALLPILILFFIAVVSLFFLGAVIASVYLTASETNLKPIQEPIQEPIKEIKEQIKEPTKEPIKEPTKEQIKKETKNIDAKPLEDLKKIPEPVIDDIKIPEKTIAEDKLYSCTKGLKGILHLEDINEKNITDLRNKVLDALTTVITVEQEKYLPLPKKNEEEEEEGESEIDDYQNKVFFLKRRIIKTILELLVVQKPEDDKTIYNKIREMQKNLSGVTVDKEKTVFQSLLQKIDDAGYKETPQFKVDSLLFDEKSLILDVLNGKQVDMFDFYNLCKAYDASFYLPNYDFNKRLSNLNMPAKEMCKIFIADANETWKKIKADIKSKVGKTNINDDWEKVSAYFTALESYIDSKGKLPRFIQKERCERKLERYLGEIINLLSIPMIGDLKNLSERIDKIRASLKQQELFTKPEEKKYFLAVLKFIKGFQCHCSEISEIKNFQLQTNTLSIIKNALAFLKTYDVEISNDRLRKSYFVLSIKVKDCFREILKTAIATTVTASNTELLENLCNIGKEYSYLLLYKNNDGKNKDIEMENLLQKLKTIVNDASCKKSATIK